jgi:hypothetical protein
MKSTKVIHENEVSIGVVKSILDDAFFTTEVDDDGDIKVTEMNSAFWIRLSSELKIIRLYCIFLFRDGSTEEAKCTLFRNLNTSIFRFNDLGDGKLFADFNLFYGGGILPANIVGIVRLFSTVVPMLMNNIDTDDIVK